MDLVIKQGWLEKSSDTSMESYKATLIDVLNSLEFDDEKTDRWSMTAITEGDVAHLVYDEKSIATMKFEDDAIKLVSDEETPPRFDYLLFAVRRAANNLYFTVYSNRHGGAMLPQQDRLSLDHTLFDRNQQFRDFFKDSRFIPRYAPEGVEYVDDKQAFVIYSPYYVEDKNDGTIHIINNPMFRFLIQKDDQATNREFSYKVADSMDDFARKYNLGLIPASFYQCYDKSVKIINNTYFDVDNISRKVFINPFVWDFSEQHNDKYYTNTKNGIHLMDKVRKGETLDQAMRRVLKEELKVADDYVAAHIWDIEFDRDRDNILTPRLKINIYVNGLEQKHRSQDHDWVSLT